VQRGNGSGEEVIAAIKVAAARQALKFAQSLCGVSQIEKRSQSPGLGDRVRELI